MKLTFSVGSRESHVVEFSWAQSVGRTRVVVDGVQIFQSTKAMGPRPNGLHSFPRTDSAGGAVRIRANGTSEVTEFEVGSSERHLVAIERIRARLLAGLLPHRYRVSVDGTLVSEARGY